MVHRMSPSRISGLVTEPPTLSPEMAKGWAVKCVPRNMSSYVGMYVFAALRTHSS